MSVGSQPNSQSFHAHCTRSMLIGCLLHAALPLLVMPKSFLPLDDRVFPMVLRGVGISSAFISCAAAFSWKRSGRPAPVAPMAMRGV